MMISDFEVKGAVVTRGILRRIFFLLLIGQSLSSCGTLLDFASHYNDCSYPGCERKARKGSSYCSHHDGGLMKDKIDNSLKRIRVQSAKRQY